MQPEVLALGDFTDGRERIDSTTGRRAHCGRYKKGHISRLTITCDLLRQLVWTQCELRIGLNPA